MALYMLSEDPSTFTATCGETITQGEFVKLTGTTEVTTTTAIDTADLIQVYACDAAGDEDTVIGVAMETGADGDMINIRTSGIFIFAYLSTNGAVLAGSDLQCSAGTATQVELLDITDGGRCIGVALTPANTTAEYVVAILNTQNGAAQAA